MPDFILRRGRFSDAFEQQSALLGWEQEYNQLGRGAFDGAVEGVTLGKVLIQRERFNVSVEQRSAAPRGTVNFGWLNAGWRVDGSPIRPPSVTAWSGGEEHLAVNAGGSDSLFVTVDAALLGIFDERPFLAVIPLDDPGVQATGEWLKGMLQLAASDPAGDRREVSTVLPGLILDRLLAIVFRVQHIARSSGPAPPRLFRHARDIVEGQPGDPLSVGQICAELGVSRETLHRAFTEAVGISPSTWLRVRRLNGAHRDLREAEGSGMSVSAIAMKWGFWHLGRFSAYYHSQFGHHPSDHR